MIPDGQRIVVLRGLTLKIPNSFVFNLISCYFISIDSSFNVLSNVFWLQFDRMKPSVPKSRNLSLGCKRALTPADRFREFAAERSNRSSQNQTQSCRRVQVLSNETKFIQFNSKLQVIQRLKHADQTVNFKFNSITIQ